ncbi:unnamed protein product [Adineta steineri]|uniref:Uncharacterized protein n=1 Tax=Adineta steineri TaxID=433720 RepID=A0A819KLW5_9BILA|nr:unnamed protein product [Adineta steineri]CAF3949174.1 unnamed protein product [Adineta steineri]
MSLSSFQAQIDSLTSVFIAQTPDKFRRTQSFIYETFRANQLLVVPETNWQFALTTAADNYVVATVPRASFGTNYSCTTSLDSFSRPLYIDANSNKIVLPSVVAGCFPVDGIRLSTLECFFDSNCILSLTNIASTRYTTIWIAKPLNASIPSIYSLNTLIGSLVDSLFVEDWGIKINPETTELSQFCANRQIIVRETWSSIFSRMVLAELVAMGILSIIYSVQHNNTSNVIDLNHSYKADEIEEGPLEHAKEIFFEFISASDSKYICTNLPLGRRAMLKCAYNFWCECQRCTFENDDAYLCTECKTLSPVIDNPNSDLTNDNIPLHKPFPACS